MCVCVVSVRERERESKGIINWQVTQTHTVHVQANKQ